MSNKDEKAVSDDSEFNKPPIPLIFIYTAIGIMLTIVFIHYVAGVDYRDNNDIFNWVSLVVEIGIGSGITIAVWRYSKFQQRKTNKLISNINKITIKLDKIINEQDKLQKSRKQFLHESMFGNLISILISAYNISQDKPIRTFALPNDETFTLNEYQSLNQMADVLDERISQFGELMEPELYASVSTVHNLLKEKNIEKQHMGSIIQQSKRGIAAIDTSLFSKDNIGGIEILDKV